MAYGAEQELGWLERWEELSVQEPGNQSTGGPEGVYRRAEPAPPGQCWQGSTEPADTAHHPRGHQGDGWQPLTLPAPTEPTSSSLGFPLQLWVGGCAGCWVTPQEGPALGHLTSLCHLLGSGVNSTADMLVIFLVSSSTRWYS